MKSLEVSHPGVGGRYTRPDVEYGLSARRNRTGLYVFLGVVTSLFFLLILAFMIRSTFSDWEHLSAPWQPLSQPWQLWINTTMLLFSSLALQWGRVASRRGISIQGESARALRSTREALLIGGMFALCFLAGQIWVWQQFIAAGYFASSNSANAFFYLLTGLHGLHLVGGLVALGRVMTRAWGKQPLQRISATIGLCAVYWHYLLVLWLILMGLLTSSPDTFAAFAKLCGF